MNWLETAYRRWDAWPFWAKAASGIGCFYVIFALLRTFREDRPVGGFFEELVAMVIHDGLVIGALVAAIALGIFVGKKTNAWFGWAAGIALMFASGWLMLMAEDIPGVGWRLRLINEAEPVEY